MGRYILVVAYLLALILSPVLTQAAGITGAGGGSSAQGLGPNFNLSGGNLIAGSSEAKPLSLRGVGGQSTSGRDWYQSSGGVWVDVCVVADVANACNYIRQLSSGFYFDIRNNAGNSIGRFDNDTGELTNVTLNGESSNNTITLTEEVWFNVVSCQNTTPSQIHDTFTSNFPEPLCNTGSNTQKGYAAFDATTDESIYGHWVLPTGFTGAIDIKFKWKMAATSGAVGWCMQLIRVADGSTSDPVFPAQALSNCVSDAAKGTTLQENDASISGVTCTGCVAGDHVYWRLSRDANGSAVTDDAAGDAFLLAFGRVWRVAH